MAAGKAEGQAAGGSPGKGLTEEIERTRMQLGETVEALAAKADVKAAARQKAAGAREHATAKAGQVRVKAADQAGKARSQLADRAVRARRTILSAGRPVREQIQGSAEATGAKAWRALPDRAQRAAKRAAVTVQRRPVALAGFAAGALFACIAAVRRRHR